MDSLTCAERCLKKLLICCVLKTWHLRRLSLHPPLPLYPSVPLSVCLSPENRERENSHRGLQRLLIISPPENTSKCSFFPPTLFLCLSVALSSLCPSLHLQCLCISADFHGLCLSLHTFYLVPSLPLLPFFACPLSSVPRCTWLAAEAWHFKDIGFSFCCKWNINICCTHTHTKTDSSLPHMQWHIAHMKVPPPPPKKHRI